MIMRCRRERNHLCFSIVNPFDPEAPSNRSGIGLGMCGRLQAQYGKPRRWKSKQAITCTGSR